MNDSDPALSVCFAVKIDDNDLGTFNSCEGLGCEVVIEQREEGGNNAFVWQLPTRLKYTNVKFTRPLADDIETAIDRLRGLVQHDMRINQVAQIGIDTVNEGNYVLVARVWVPRREAMQVRFDLNRAVKEEFQRRPPTREEARAAD